LALQVGLPQSPEESEVRLIVLNPDGEGEFYATAAITEAVAKEGKLGLHGHPARRHYYLPWVDSEGLTVTIPQGERRMLTIARIDPPHRTAGGWGCSMDLLGVLMPGATLEGRF
jgi:hypothetical protein